MPPRTTTTAPKVSDNGAPSADNLFNRDYWETQNYFESQLPGQLPIERIHATPSFRRTLVVGVTVKLGGK